MFVPVVVIMYSNIVLSIINYELITATSLLPWYYYTNNNNLLDDTDGGKWKTNEQFFIYKHVLETLNEGTSTLRLNSLNSFIINFAQ